MNINNKEYKNISSNLTLVPGDTLKHYLWEISQYPVLSPQKQEKLAYEYHKTKDKKVAGKLVTSNLRLVVKIAMEHQRYWMNNLLDLIQEGNTGLLQAIRKFDPFRGIKFSYYASFWIKAYILKFVMDNWRLVRLGTTQTQRKLFYNLSKEKKKLEAMGITATANLLAKQMDVSEKDIVEMNQRLDSWELSLDNPINDDSKTPYQKFLPDNSPTAENCLAEKELWNIFFEEISQFSKTINKKELNILKNRILSETPKTLKDLGKEYNISRERIRQIQVRLLEKLRIYMEKKVPDFKNLFFDLVKTKKK